MSATVYVTRPLPQELLTALAAVCELRLASGEAPLSSGNLPTAVRDCAGIICLLTDQIDADLVAALPQLKFVSSISVGVDHIDVDALTARSIALGHTPGVLVDATADLAFALLLAAARRLGEADRFVRAGQWRADNAWSPDFFLGKDVSGATLGLIGMGAIGQAVARRAAGFGMRVLSWNRTPRAVAGVVAVPLEELLENSDFVSVHVARTQQTLGLLDAARLAQMKKGAVLINTARGGIVDEQALARALDSGDLYAAGLDVYDSEPLPPGSPLLTHPRVVLAPHIGSATAATRRAMVTRALDNALAAVTSRQMPYCANPQVYEGAPPPA